MSDSVNNPPHYKQGEVETIDGIRAALGGGFVSYCRGNVLKYVWRCGKKGDAIEDLRKAAKYLEWAIGAMDGNASEIPKSSAGKPLEIPDGWRELHDGEKRLKTDLYGCDGKWCPYIDFDPAGSVMTGYDKTIHYKHIRKIEAEKPSESQSGNHAEGVWVEEAGEVKPVDSIPDPGPGYRLLSKDPPERVIKGDEFYFDGEWEESDNWSTDGAQSDSYYYRRKIEPAEWIPKVGDKVRVIRLGRVATGHVGKITEEISGLYTVQALNVKSIELEAKDLELIEAAQ